MASQNAMSLRTKKFKPSIIWLKDALLTIQKINITIISIKENQEEKKEQF